MYPLCHRVALIWTVYYSICTFPQPNHCPCCCCCCPADVDVPALRAPEGWELSWPVSHTLHILIQLRCYISLQLDQGLCKMLELYHISYISETTPN